MLRQRRSEKVSEEFEPKMKNPDQKKESGENVILFLPFILQLAFMTFTAFFIMHVHVRFLSYHIMDIDFVLNPTGTLWLWFLESLWLNRKSQKNGKESKNGYGKS
jgi:hypothetical protein